MSNLDKSLVTDLPIFAGVEPDSLDEILREAQSIRYPKGSSVFQQDQEASSFFILLHGHLRVMKVTPDGQQIVVRFVAPGEIFGIAVAMGRSTYPATALAVVDSISLVWPAAAWPRLTAKHPSLAINTMQSVGNRLQDAHTRVIEMSTEQVERRVAHALLRLAQQAGRKGQDGIEIDFPISRQDVAEITGTTLHTVSRLLSAWEDQGLVNGGRQRISIKNPHKLFLLAEAPSH
ncbi:Crp/Fnr family transcriptional regulator [Microvirga sp. Mcv34]|uniref:Crp/Fnr family transcriptional regulator n=1 Tax=Microvirga sp. Mcv34 TaxID=2926016 RepID=UPI0021C991EC|nr:Crp/Fnr family transcriptional regulator [Microvirga sp. Mcv34]